jgi:hypothetical protein
VTTGSGLSFVPGDDSRDPKGFGRPGTKHDGTSREARVVLSVEIQHDGVRVSAVHGGEYPGLDERDLGERIVIGGIRMGHRQGGWEAEEVHRLTELNPIRRRLKVEDGRERRRQPDRSDVHVLV